MAERSKIQHNRVRSELVRMRKSEYLLKKVWMHMRGYNTDGKRRDPFDDVSCLGNWNNLHRLLDAHHGAKR